MAGLSFNFRGNETSEVDDFAEFFAVGRYIDDDFSDHLSLPDPEFSLNDETPAKVEVVPSESLNQVSDYLACSFKQAG